MCATFYYTAMGHLTLEWYNEAIYNALLENVKVMALCATASNHTRTAIIRSLDMQKLTIVSVLPLKDNITYAVGEKSSISAAFVTLAKGLAEQRTEMGRVIIFCRR